MYIMCVQRFEPLGRRFTNFHYYIIICIFIIIIIIIIIVIIITSDEKNPKLSKDQTINFKGIL